jgi:hypothetical protein
VQVQGLNFRIHAGLSSHSTGYKYRYIHTSEAVDVCFHCENPPAWMLKFLLYHYRGCIGIWTAHLRKKTNLQQLQVNKALKNLESKSLVKPVKTVAVKSFLLSLQTSDMCPGVVLYSLE